MQLLHHARINNYHFFRSGSILIVSLMNGDINGIDSESGQILWTIETGNKLLQSTSISPKVRRFCVDTVLPLQWKLTSTTDFLMQWRAAISGYFILFDCHVLFNPYSILNLQLNVLEMLWLHTKRLHILFATLGTDKPYYYTWSSLFSEIIYGTDSILWCYFAIFLI